MLFKRENIITQHGYPARVKMVKIVSWNIAKRKKAWRKLSESDADFALLQEANQPPRDIADSVQIDPQPWKTAGTKKRPWRAAVVKLSESYDIQWLKPKSLEKAKSGDYAVSRLGTLAAGVVKLPSKKPIILVSLYGIWENHHPICKGNRIHADGSVHRLISDLSTFIRHKDEHRIEHRIIAAGDLNILYGYGEGGSSYWGSRYATVFNRLKALGLQFAGPQAPEGGREADPWPEELPKTSKNVPTYHTNHQSPETATRQLDFVFASKSLIDDMNVRAINNPKEWGPSDHCRVEIEL